MSMEDNYALRERYNLLKGVEHQKNGLIEELLHRIDQLTNDFHQEKLDHARESHFNREVQQREINLQDELRRYKNAMERDPFILVLIDGDGMIFDDRLISKGESGGKEAATMLWDSVSQYVQSHMTNLPLGYRIVTRVYANLKGLGDVCHRSGITDRSERIEEFARGFTGSKQLFDFVDVGMGKDRADDKIIEIFKLHMHDCHCRQILFGCSHDNGYARLLEDITDPAILNSITLLEGVPFEKELAMLKSTYQTTRFEGLFRKTKINVYQQATNGAPPGLATHQSPHINGLQPAENQYYQSPYQLTSSPLTGSQAPTASSLKGSPDSTHASALNPTAPTWASTAMTAPPYVASPPPTPQPTPQRVSVVPRNRYGQRIDPVIQFDANEVKRIKSKKMCNVHFLRDDCPYDPCTHDHHYKPTKNELTTLRYVSRLTPCKFGSECDDLKCIYGHVCPNSVDGKKDCRWGVNCRFEREQHGIDTTPVKTMKVGGK